MSGHDQIYGDERARRLLELLRVLAARIGALERTDDLRNVGPELIKLMGDARSELFHYEVRCTYDSPEVAESRRIVEQAKQQAEYLDLPGPLDFEQDNPEDDPPWQG